MLLMKKKKMQILLITAICILPLGISISTSIEHYTKKAQKIQRYETYVVQQNDTLWNISKMFRPDEDPRKVIYEIQKHNNITQIIRPGQVIEIPLDKE
jgi:LysM repeat protein